MTTYLLATGNAKKGKELEEIVRAEQGPHHRVLTLRDLGLADLVVVEDAPDFAGNATKKADAALAALAARPGHGVDVVLADDSGLCVDALDGHPGVRSARWSADCGTALSRDGHPLPIDEANNLLLLTLLEPVPHDRRRARYHAAVIGVTVTDRAVYTASGEVHGFIARDLRGEGGFGYDPLFIVDDGPDALRGRRMAELTADEKHGISHRGRALRALLRRLSSGVPDVASPATDP